MANRKLFLLPGDGIGPEIAGSVRAWFSDEHNLHLIRRLRDAGAAEADHGDRADRQPEAKAGPAAASGERQRLAAAFAALEAS